MRSEEGRHPAPRHLSTESRRLWRWALETFALELHHVRLLRLLCEALDRAEAARLIVEAEGLTVPDRYGVPKTNPAVAIRRDAETIAARLVRELRLDDEAASDVRLPRPGRGR